MIRLPHRSRTLAAVALILVGLITACSSGQAPAAAGSTASASQDTVTILVDTSNISGIPLYVAQDRGYFRQAGVQVNIQDQRGSGALMPPLIAQGVADGFVGGLSSALVNALDQGFDIRLVADQGDVDKSHNSTYLMVRRELYNAGTIQSAHDLATQLRGRNVIFGTEGSPLDYFMSRTLERYGLTKDDVVVKYGAGGIDFAALFQNQAIDLGPVFEPKASAVQTAGLASMVAGEGDLLGTVETGGLFLSGPFITQHHDTAVALLRGYLRAYQDLAAQGTEWSPAVAAIGAKWTQQDVSVVTSVSPEAFGDGSPVMASIEDQIAFYQESGLVKDSTVTADKIVDPTLFNEAKGARG